MAHLKLLLGAAMAVTLAGGANAQIQADTEIVRAQHIRPGDVSPEEYQALLDEAERYSAYQNSANAYADTATEASSSYQIEIFEAPSASSDMVATTYSAPSSSTYATTTYAAPTETIVATEYPMAKTYPLGTDFSSAEFSAQSATTTYSAPITTGTTTTYAAPVTVDSMVSTSTPSISYGVTSYSSPTTSYQSTNQSSHYVVKGDTLYNIAKRNNVSVAELKSVNGLSDNTIGLGQTLVIPGGSRVVNVETNSFSAPVTSATTATVTQPYVSSSRPTLVRNVEPLPAGNNYAVLPKDTLYSISRRACVSVSDIRAVNGNLDPHTLQPGQRLTLPGGHCMR